MNSDKDLLLKAFQIEKSFGQVKVLKKVNLEIKRGEVHALMGENGAGKSTLIKILTGAYTKDDGKIYYNGNLVSINDRSDASKLGIACIYQELSVIETLTVAQNVLMGKEPKIGKTPIINKRKMNLIVKNLIDKYGFPLSPTDFVEQLTIGKRQIVEILKALSSDASLIIMDEPTASLSSKESELLFQIIETLRNKGVSILYISHRLEEVYRLSDRLTVLRDGENVIVLEKNEIIPEQVIQHMIGKRLDDSQTAGQMRKNNNEIVLEVKNLTRKGVFSDISFQAHKGEILGFGGLIGSGRTELIRCIFGTDKFDDGEIFLNGQKYNPTTKKSIQNGIGFVPEDRRSHGFVPLLSVNKNAALPNYDLIDKKLGAISDSAELNFTKEVIKKMDVRPNDPNKKVGLLSGGNQQKVVVGKWLMRDLKILIIDEPTAGIDVGAKEEIYNIIEGLAKSGVLVILISSDLQELIRVSHRIIVLRKGMINSEFDDGIIEQKDVLCAASGLKVRIANE